VKSERAGLLRETYHIINAMRRAGNYGVIARWKDSVARWAQLHPDNADAAAVLAWLPFWQVRPFYTVEELAPVWPALAIATGYTDRWPIRKSLIKSPARLESELDFHRLPRVPGYPRYFICERFRHWRNATEEEIALEMQKSDLPVFLTPPLQECRNGTSV
jgi:hypothetical protein